MNLFEGLTFEEGNITVLGANKDSAFISDLAEYINKSDKKISINAPDIMNEKYFSVHSENEISDYKNNGYVIGIVDIDVFEKKICDVIKNYEEFCLLSNISSDELVYPCLLAKAIIRENYNILYIDNVNTVSKRFLARELAKNIRNGMGIRIINTDNGDTEILCR